MIYAATHPGIPGARGANPRRRSYLHILPDITFPVNDKMTPENVMRQVLQEFGWPTTPNLSHVQFYFGKLLKELHHDRIVPVLLFEHTEILRMKTFNILSILTEHTVDRRPLGVPSILYITVRRSAFHNATFRSGIRKLGIRHVLGSTIRDTEGNEQSAINGAISTYQHYW